MVRKRAALLSPISLGPRDVPSTAALTMQGIVWVDQNADSKRGPAEPAMANVKVDLLKSSSSGKVLVSSTKTDANGKYQFRIDVDANYVIRVNKPNGYDFSRPLMVNLDGLPYSNITDPEAGEASFQVISRGMFQGPLSPINAGLMKNASTFATPEFGFGFAKSFPSTPSTNQFLGHVDQVGNSYVLGYSGSNIPTPNPVVSGAFVAKFDSQGKQHWKQTIQGTNVFPGAVSTDLQGNVYLVGNKITSIETQYPGLIGTISYTDAFAIKLSPSGSILWQTDYKSPGIDSWNAIAVDVVGNVFVGGSTTPANGKKSDAPKPYIARISAVDGKYRSQNTVGTLAGSVNAIVADGVGGARFAGTSGNPQNYSDMTGFIGKLPPTGTPVIVGRFEKPPGKTGTSVVNKLFVDPSGNWIFAGTFSSGSIDFDPGTGKLERVINSTPGDLYGTDIFVAKYDPVGKPIWVRTLGGEFFDSLADAAVGPDGRIHLSGSIYGTADFDPGPGVISRNGMYNPFLLSLDSGGNFERLRYSETTSANGYINPQQIKVNGRGDLYLGGTYVGTPDIDPTDKKVALAKKTYSDISPPPFLAKWTNLAPVKNQSPTVTLPTGFTIVEGATLALTANVRDPENDRLTYSWDINGDGKFGDSTSANPSLTWANLEALGINDSTISRSIAVRVSDGVNPAVEKRTTLRVFNGNPTGTLAIVGRAIVGQATTFAWSAFNDPSSKDRTSLMFHFDFNDDGVYESISNRSTRTHAFLKAGEFRIRSRVVDKDGGYVERSIKVIVSPQ